MSHSSKSIEAPAHGEQPKMWLILGEKPGDNAQILNLAEATGFSFEAKKMFVKPKWVNGKPRVRPTLDYLDLGRSDSLDGPWPELVMTAGRRMSCVGLWIKEASGGRTRIVMVGRPRRLFDSIDLIVVAAHYVMKPGPNVARHSLPLMQIDPVVLENAANLWRARLGEMPRPLTALMVGGPTGGLRFDLETARRLFEETLKSVKESGGSLYITTSRRTPKNVVEMLRERCPESARLFEFDASATANENPYHALLGLADRFVVTTDSASMLVEVARLGRSLAIYPLEAEIGFFEGLLESIGLVRPLSPRSDPNPAGGFRARMMYRLGRPVHSRDLSAIPRLLVEKGMAGWLGEDWVHPGALVDDEIESVAARIRDLVETPRNRRTKI